MSVLGMFGAPQLYETEIRRVDAARQRIRRKEEAAARRSERDAARETAAAAASARRARSRRAWPIRLARAVVPGFARARLRSLLPTAPSAVGRPRRIAAPGSIAPFDSVEPGAGTTPFAVEPPAIDLEAFLRFSVADLWYASSDLDRAMDLLAVCRVDGQAPLS